MTQLSMVSRFTQLKEYPPTFLAPRLECRVASRSQQPKFSTSASLHVRKRDGNTNRGVSALRGTGLRYPVSMSKEPLPVPVLDPKRRSKITVDENHGLWGFFNNDRKALSTPEEENACGKYSIPFTVSELG